MIKVWRSINQFTVKLDRSRFLGSLQNWIIIEMKYGVSQFRSGLTSDLKPIVDMHQN